jgi:DNA-binding transcriptional LysR family regulator
MDFTLRQLRAFATIARLRSFTRAADVLHTTQPALSAQIRELEASLGVRLFDRNTRTVAPTRAGADLVPVVEQVLGALASVVAQAENVAARNTGRVVVAALPSLAATLVPDVVARMRERHPGIVVVVRDALAERTLAAVRAGEVDLALTSAPPHDRELVFAPLLADRMMAVLPRAHPLARSKVLRLADLLATPLVLMDRESSVRRLVDAASASIGRLATPAYEVAFMATAIGLVRAGLGATLLPSSAAELRDTTGLCVRKVEAPTIERPLGLLTQRRRGTSPAVEAFVAVLGECLRARGAGTRSRRG